MTKSELVVVQLLSCVQLFATLETAAHQAYLSFTISQSLFKLVSIELVMPSNHPILCISLIISHDEHVRHPLFVFCIQCLDILNITKVYIP